MAEKNVFRKISLERLSSPEELDQRLTVVSPIGWVALIAVSFLVAAALIWGFFGSIAEKATGTGIILSSGGITPVVHHANGLVTDVSVKDGDYVTKGQVIARIEQPELIEEINKAKEDLAAAKFINLDTMEVNEENLNFNVYGKIGELYKDYKAARAYIETQRAYYNSQKAEAESALEQSRVQYEAAKERYENYKTLYESGAVSLNDLNEAERQLNVCEVDYNAKLKNLNALPYAQLMEAETNSAAQEQLIKDTIRLSIADLEQNIQKMQQDLINNSDIVASASGRILEMQIKKGSIVQAGSIICTIGEEKEQTDAFEAVVYVPVDQGKRIKPGMEVNISPTTVKKEEYGFMLGNVVSVSQYPASAQGMMLTLGNSELVQQLSGEGAPIEVRVKLIMDSSTESGYKWSTPKGPPMVIDDGTFCVGEVKVAQKRPISMVIPFIKKILPI